MNSDWFRNPLLRSRVFFCSVWLVYVLIVKHYSKVSPAYMKQFQLNRSRWCEQITIQNKWEEFPGKKVFGISDTKKIQTWSNIDFSVFFLLFNTRYIHIIYITGFGCTMHWNWINWISRKLNEIFKNSMQQNAENITLICP